MKDNTNTLTGCISTEPREMDITERIHTVKVIIVMKERKI